MRSSPWDEGGVADRQARSRVDRAVGALNLEQIAGAAIEAASRLGASYASLLVTLTRSSRHILHNTHARPVDDRADIALGVRVFHQGRWGHAGTDIVSAAGAAVAAERAIAVARACRGFARAPADFVSEPAHQNITWVAPYKRDPFTVPEHERVGLLREWASRALDRPPVEHVLIYCTNLRDTRFFADSAGTSALQQRVRVHPMVTVSASDRDGQPVAVRSSGPPAGRGWEYLEGDGWDWYAELNTLPERLAAKLDAKPLRPGHYDLVLDGSTLWHAVHETVGHATELDRALGHEASYAGTTFVSPEDVGSLVFGSPLMNIDADRTTPHGLATLAIDDEGVATQSWPLIESGVLVGMQSSRGTAGAVGDGRSRGCAVAETALFAPMERMPNVSLQPAIDGPDTEALIAAVDDGFYLEGADSGSIDAERVNFQFTAQTCHRIRAGRLCEPVRDLAYLGRTPEFWASLAAVGGPATYGLFGADLCGKGQPLQVAAASHGCPAATFRNVRVDHAGPGFA